jgi:PAN domain
MPNHFVEGQGFQRSVVASATDCEQLCARQPSCQLYEFYRPDKSCSLYDQIKKSAPSKDADVGYRVGSAAAATPGSATGGPKLWNHNGSTMTLQFDGNRRRFIYEVPRPGMAARGVRQGTVLFDGTRSADVYTGTSKLFRGPPCGEFNYTVAGSVAPDQKSVTLRGRAPNVEEGTCRITGYRDDELVFTLIE